MQCPLDYSLCDRTVTVYGFRDGRLVRQVFPRAMYQYWQSQKLDRTGKTQETGCLLIIPGQADICPGDRVCPGEGPEEIQWAEFLPVRVPGVCQLSYVKPCFWGGEICHTEAGRKQVQP